MQKERHLSLLVRFNVKLEANRCSFKLMLSRGVLRASDAHSTKKLSLVTAQVNKNVIAIST